MENVDTQSFRSDYLNGMSAQEWCEYGLRLTEEYNQGLMAHIDSPTRGGGLPPPYPSSSSELTKKLSLKSHVN